MHSAAHAQTVIDFELLPPGTVVTNQYPEVTFSSPPGVENKVLQVWPHRQFLCSWAIGSPTPTCVEDTYLDFATPVSRLSFLAIEPNCSCPNAEFRVFQNHVHTATVTLTGLGSGGSKLVDLSAYDQITRLEIVNILVSPLEGGIGWDKFSFFPTTLPTFCGPKLNSQGCLPALSSSGIVSASAGAGFLLIGAPFINGKPGLLFYGISGSNSQPFFGGTLCVMPPIARTPVVDSQGNPPPDDCSGIYSIDFNAWIASGQDPALVAGRPVWAQYWARDPADPDMVSLSNGIGFTIGN